MQIKPSKLSICGHLRASVHLTEISYFQHISLYFNYPSSLTYTNLSDSLGLVGLYL
ncbi:uncharacterized protein LACBIDRAFT_315436 [Laccaria bicolor S238N-H82]|uniref:Predicted protein n=1 Tax=Laccaria bicolor (strain S238N-H82 / ATCC MYA-4686) TaxID=486041 RepID=B0D2D7_LACBS|nr:uncharacterized protein LACBIDRAFT_315436 [Laccaria bicolor S238N-H82]EDR11082.1 predicted protein [Laccaria bicolor S238N-H82]|eukprot:XP_001878383.1 predicted protein [Laccaria bicolor S238N-H82]